MALDAAYMIPLGAFKIAEFFCLLIGWATMADQFVKVDVSQKGGRVNFFLAICILSWIFVIILFVCKLKGAFDNFISTLKYALFGVIHLIFGLLVLIAASLVADRRCATNMARSYVNIHCLSDQYKTAAAFGIISAIILICDAIYHVVDFMFGRKKPAGKASKKQDASDKYVAKDIEIGEMSADDSKAEAPAVETHEKSVDDDERVFEVPADAAE